MTEEHKAFRKRVAIMATGAIITLTMMCIALAVSGESPGCGAVLSGLRGCGEVEPPCSSYVTGPGLLMAVFRAQELYKNDTGKYGDYFDLNDWKHRRYIEPWLAMRDPDHPQHEAHSGFIIDISVNADNSDWWAISTPSTWREHPWVKGLYSRNYKIDSEGHIYYNETEGDTKNFPKVKNDSDVDMLERMVDAQKRYKIKHGVYGTLEQIGYVFWQASTGKYGDVYHGYKFWLKIAENGEDWSCITQPVKWGVDGTRNAWIDSDGVIYYNETEGDIINFPHVFEYDWARAAEAGG